VSKLSSGQIEERNQARSPSRLPLVVVLNHIRSLYNVGSIFRTSDAAGVEKIWITGITGCPPNPQISKTALGAEKTVPWEYRERASGVLRELKTRGYQIVLLEQTDRSVPYQDFEWQSPVCLVLGNENSGVSNVLLPLADAAVEIEMTGIKHSLNVTVAFGIIAYHFPESASPATKRDRPRGLSLFEHF